MLSSALLQWGWFCREFLDGILSGAAQEENVAKWFLKSSLISSVYLLYAQMSGDFWKTVDNF